MGKTPETVVAMTEAADRISDKVMDHLNDWLEEEAKANPLLNAPRQMGAGATAISEVVCSMLVNTIEIGNPALAQLMIGLFGERLNPLIVELEALAAKAGTK